MYSVQDCLIDFYAGTHGHFLEYLVNTYIYKTPKVDTVFTDIGTSHGILNDREYQINKKARCGHYTETNRQISYSSPYLIRIAIEDFKGHVCFHINSDYRAHDDPDRRLLDLNDPITKQRDAYYYRLTEISAAHYLKYSWIDYSNKIFDFNIVSFYDFYELTITLQKLSKFLQKDFFPDRSLKVLWDKFMSKNHAVLAWDKCQLLISKIFNNENYEFDSKVEEQALLNALIFRMTGIEPEELFVVDNYPSNTADIYSILKSYNNK
jgi:hypothetical protein